jgi:hypothetical protein
MKIPAVLLLLSLWIVGLATGHTLSGFVHTLLIPVVVLIVLWVREFPPLNADKD